MRAHAHMHSHLHPCRQHGRVLGKRAVCRAAAAASKRAWVALGWRCGGAAACTHRTTCMHAQVAHAHTGAHKHTPWTCQHCLHCTQGACSERTRCHIHALMFINMYVCVRNVVQYIKNSMCLEASLQQAHAQPLQHLISPHANLFLARLRREQGA